MAVQRITGLTHRVMNAANKEKSTVTKRDLATRVRLTLKPDVKMHQALVADVITHTLDAIRDALVNGNTVELRNFGVFKIEIRKERIGRNPKDPSVDIRIPARKVVKFRSGKEMKNQLEASAEAEASAAPESSGAGFDSE